MSNFASWKTYFEVRAGHVDSGAISVSILPQAALWGAGHALGRLGESIELGTWAHGGHFLSFHSAEQWEQLRAPVMEFVDAVMQGRSEHLNGVEG